MPLVAPVEVVNPERFPGAVLFQIANVVGGMLDVMGEIDFRLGKRHAARDCGYLRKLPVDEEGDLGLADEQI